MADIPLAEALLLWDSGFNGNTPCFAVRPLGHDDYWRYEKSDGACWVYWREVAKEPEKRLLLCKALVSLWHIAAAYEVPIKMIHEAMLVVPEYRDMLADDFLPKQWRWERESE